MAGRDEEFSPPAASISAGANENTRAEVALGKMLADSRVPMAALWAERFEAPLSATEGRINRYSLADMEPADLLAERGHLTKQFVTRNNREFEVRFRRRHRFPLQKAEVAATDAGDLAFDDCPVFVGQIGDRHVGELEVGKAGKMFGGRLAGMSLTGEDDGFHK